MNAKTIQELLRYQDALNRRTFLSRSASGLGLTALASLTARDARAVDRGGAAAPQAGIADLPHFPPKVKRVIYLFQSGAPSQMDLYDYKPSLEKHRGLNLPDSIRKGQRLTGMTSGQATFPVAPSMFKFNQNPRSGTWTTELLPRIGAMSDQIAVIRSMHTDAINHDPAITFFQTGQQIAGRPSIGSWLAYGLGSENEDLPAYVVLTSKGTGRSDDQPLYDRLWGSGFLPTQYQGVKFRNNGDPVLYLSDPPGISRGTRRDMLDELRDLNQMRRDATGDPEITTRILQYEMAFRMQTSVPDLIDIKQEPARVLEAYGPNVRKTGSYAYNCLLARRLAERGVRFIQLFHMGWDQHFNLPKQIRGQCSDVDQPTAALLQDLQQRGLLEDTLVVWGGEFGRTVYSQGKLSVDDYGRDHHPRCFTIWMAGGGVKQGLTYGETDDFCYNIVRDPVSVHDLHATILRLLGIDHERFTYKFQGLDARLSGVDKCRVVKEILA